MTTTAVRALVLDMMALEEGFLPLLAGELAHAAFYAIVETIDPVLSQQMHDAQGRSAFAISPLYGYWRTPYDRKIKVHSGQGAWMRVSLLDDTLFEVFQKHLLSSPLPTIQIGRIPLAITQVYGAPGSHPWCGYTTVEQLAALEPGEERWTVEFASPTAIRWGSADNAARRIEIFPQPRMVVAGLRARWDRLTGEQWGRDFEEWVERNVIVGAVRRWQMESFTYQRQQYRGGIGVLDYQLLDGGRREHLAHLNRLFHLAFYTGVGYKTTMGLGQVRLI
ncbi:MAG: CRISPR-associated endoribonuclease Cas6 [Chloroflexi bacterium]|nr:CRISPR-associated endoribonuclease Cas6 [Chloroflexota bacterium]